jgi:hypothetical protein
MPCTCIIVLTNYDLTEYKEADVSLMTDFFLEKARDFDRFPSLMELCEGHHPIVDRPRFIAIDGSHGSVSSQEIARILLRPFPLYRRRRA